MSTSQIKNLTEIIELLTDVAKKLTRCKKLAHGSLTDLNSAHTIIERNTRDLKNALKGVHERNLCTIKQTTKKYTDRPSPPYPAASCEGHVKKGNDNKMYESIANAKGVYTWKLKK